MMKSWVLLALILISFFLPNLRLHNQNSALPNRVMLSSTVLGDSASENQITEYCESIYEKSLVANLSDMPVETVISRRISIHYSDESYSNFTVPSELISKVLWAAYGYSSSGRTTPTLSSYPVIIYVCNETSACKFIPENQNLTIWKQGDYRGLSGGLTAPIQLYIAFDTNKCQDSHWGNAESGTVIQNIYLMANVLNLGTVCEGGSWLDRENIHQGLDLPENEEVVYKMPLGYPLPPYVNYSNLVPSTRPSSPQLPEIRDSNVSLENALNLIHSSHEWSSDTITQQELSQVLWAGYGYSYFFDTVAGRNHRTVPSADSYYPMRIYAANSTGVYKYIPEQHNLTTVVAEDRRPNIASASGNSWASTAPLIIATVWNDSRILTVNTTYVEVGLIAQNVYLESAAWGLITDWGKADSNETAMREALGLAEETNLHPASIITVGHPSTSFDLNIESTQGGVTDPLPGIYNYQTGFSVNVTAIPSSGYSFDHWMIDGENSTENPITVIMNANHTLEAVFIDNIPPTIGIPIQNPPENVLPNQNVTVAVSVADSGLGVNNVTLLYTINNGTTWTPLNMTEVSTNIYQTTIPGHENGTWVTYKIVAYDNNGNSAINDNNGYFYVYHVIPEFSIWFPIFLAFLILTFAITVYKRKSLIKHKEAS
jgi:hypothetical protein